MSRAKRISMGQVKRHALDLSERSRGGSKIYYGYSVRSCGYWFPSGEECIRIDGVIWSSDWRELLEDSLQDIESMLVCGFASSAREAVDMLAGRSFADWLDDRPDVVEGVIDPEIIEPLTDALFESGVDGAIVQVIYESLILGVVPSRGQLVELTGCTDWRARKSIERLEEITLDYAEAYRIERLVSEIVEALAE